MHPSGKVPGAGDTAYALTPEQQQHQQMLLQQQQQAALGQQEPLDQDLLRVLAALQSPDNAVRNEAERALHENYITPRPDYILLALANVLRFDSSSVNRSLSAVLLRRFAVQNVALKSAASNSDKDESSISIPRILSINADARNRLCTVLLQALVTQTDASVGSKVCNCISEIALTMEEENIQYPNLLETTFQLMQAPQPELCEYAFKIISTLPSMLMPNEMPNSQLTEMAFGTFMERPHPLKVRLACMCAATYLLMYAAEMQSPPPSSFFASIMQKIASVLPQILEDSESSFAEALSVLLDLAENRPNMFRSVIPVIFSICHTVIASAPASTCGLCSPTAAGAPTMPNGVQEKQCACPNEPQIGPFQNETRKFALELIVTLVEARPSMMRKNIPDYVARLVPAFLNMMTEIDDDDTSSWEAEEDLDFSSHSNESEMIYNAAEEAMDRVAQRIGDRGFAQITFQIAVPWLFAPDWRRRHAALLAISSIVEGCKKYVEPELSNIVDHVVRAVLDPHPRVRHAMCNCLGQLCTDFKPNIQKKFIDKIVSALVACMNNEGHPRVQSHGAAAVINLCDECDASTLQPHASTLFENLFKLIMHKKCFVQIQALTSMNKFIESLGSLFAPFAARLLALLQEMMALPNESDYKKLRGHALSCATLIAVVVAGPFLGKSESKKILDSLERIQSEVTQPEDPQAEFLMQGWARMCQVLGRDFEPYLPMIIPPIHKAITTKSDTVELGPDQSADAYSYEDGWIVAEYLGRRFANRASSLDEKRMALEMLLCYSRVLGTTFAPYAVSFLENVIEVFRFNMNDSIRHLAVSLLPHLVRAVAGYQGVAGHAAAKCNESEAMTAATAAAVAASGATADDAAAAAAAVSANAAAEATIAAADETDDDFRHPGWRMRKLSAEQVFVVRNMFSLCFKTLMDQIPIENDQELLSLMVSVLGEIVAIVGHEVTTEQVKEFVALALSLLGYIFDRVTVRAKEREENGEVDDNDDDSQNDIDDLENAILVELHNAMQAFFRTFKRNMLPFFAPVLQAVVVCLRSENLMMVQFGITVVLDMFECASPEAFEVIPVIAPRILELLNCRDIYVRQMAAYCIGLIAMVGNGVDTSNCGGMAEYISAAAERVVTRQVQRTQPPLAVVELCSASLTGLAAIVEASDARASDNGEVTESALCAIAKILEHCPEAFAGGDAQREHALNFVISGLPVILDTTDAIYSTNLICRLIETRHPAVGQASGTLVYALIEVLQSDIRSESRQTTERATRALVSLVNAFSDEQKQQLAKQLSERHRVYLSQLLSAAEAAAAAAGSAAARN